MKIRIIIQSDDSGNRERVCFTEDLHAPIEDYIVPGMALDSDTVCNMELPDGFPLEHELIRV